MSVRIAIPLIAKGNWTGGYNYVLNLFAVLHRFARNRVEPVLYAPDDVSRDDLAPFEALSAASVKISPVFRARNARIRLANALMLGSDRDAVHLFRRDRIDVIFESATFHGWRTGIPAIAWLPDFQHKHLREYFSPATYWRREIGLRVQIASRRTVMLSSEDARQDCERFYRSSVGRTTVVRFAVPPGPEMTAASPREVAREYRLPRRFFYLPNQFWKHKNHVVVVEALELLKRRGCAVVVAASGNAADFRHPDHFTQLKERVASSGLEDQFRFVGMVPRPHVFALLRGAAAMLNPSRFEGWSTTVEEARALGVPLILSDIPVHHEQGGRGARYFSPDDAEALAQLLDADTTPVPESSERLPDGHAESRCAEFAAEFASVVERAAGLLG